MYNNNFLRKGDPLLPYSNCNWHHSLGNVKEREDERVGQKAGHRAHQGHTNFFNRIEQCLLNNKSNIQFKNQSGVCRYLGLSEVINVLVHNPTRSYWSDLLLQKLAQITKQCHPQTATFVSSGAVCLRHISHSLFDIVLLPDHLLFIPYARQGHSWRQNNGETLF